MEENSSIKGCLLWLNKAVPKKPNVRWSLTSNICARARTKPIVLAHRAGGTREVQIVNKCFENPLLYA